MTRPARPLVKLATFGLVLAAAFGGGALIGATLGPEPSAPPTDHVPVHDGAP
jgi:hypothetical protein